MLTAGREFWEHLPFPAVRWLKHGAQMADVIKVNFKVAWKVPVCVRGGDGFREKVNGPEVALQCLNSRWPERQSSWYRTATRYCLLAWCDEASADVARQAFVDAAAYAKMLA
jgi:hypothetical protein